VVDLEAAFVLYATPNVAARLGYRYLDADLEADAGTASVSLQGLFAGVGIAW
jgi:opacity protein-like surface antigen